MKRRQWWIAAAALALVAGTAWGGSIWAKANLRNPDAAHLTQDDKARYVGDVLTIKIDEGATVETKKNRTLDKTTGQSGTGNAGEFTLGDLLPFVGKVDQVFKMPEYTYEMDTAANLTGKGENKEEETYTDMVTVVVEDVLPNGTLLVLGKRTREVSGSRRIIQVSGIVRPSDIDETNVVVSERVANFHVVYSSQGQENTYLRSGWLTRLWNLFNPF